MPTHERRSEADGWVQVDDAVEHRDSDGERVLRVAGYAALFDTPSERMGRVVETLDRAAFDKVMADGPDVRMLEQHDGTPLARTSSGTLRLEVDERGLAFEADLDPRSQRARDLYYAIERGDISQMSFGFIIGADEKVGEDDDGTQRYHVTEVARLLEVSAVTFPAYEPTHVETVDDADEAAADDACDGCGERGDACRCGDERALQLMQAARRRRHV